MVRCGGNSIPDKQFGLPVASCHTNNNGGRSFDTGVCRKSKEPPVGAYCDNILLFFTLNHAFHSVFINTNLVRYVNYNKIVSYRVDIYQQRISIPPPVKHQNGLHVEGFERIRSHKTWAGENFLFCNIQDNLRYL